MPIIEHMTETGQEDPAANDGQPGTGAPEKPPIADLLKSLRGTKTLRQVETDTGVSNAYLCNIELGLKRPGIKTLSKLASYYQAPLHELLQVMAIPFEKAPTAQASSVKDIQRGYAYVIDDPVFSHYQKPAETMPVDAQRFVVQMYEHYTGKRLI